MPSTWLNTGPINFTETSALNYHSALCNILEEHRSHPHRGGSPQSVSFNLYFDVRYLCFSN